MLRGCLPMVEGRWCWDRVRSRWTARVLQESDGSARRNAFFMLYNADEALAIQYFTRIAEDVRDGSVARVCGGGAVGLRHDLTLVATGACAATARPSPRPSRRAFSWRSWSSHARCAARTQPRSLASSPSFSVS